MSSPERETHPGERKAQQGVCPDCGGPSKVWTVAEIQEAKADIGMGDEDDFHDICDKCAKANGWGPQ